MRVELDVVLRWGRGVMLLIGALAAGMGVISACAPQRSIALYQRIMAWLNWRVHPIDEARELRNTRRLGVTLLILSVVLGGLVCWYWG